MSASEGFQSLCSHSLDLMFPLFSLQLRVHRDQDEFEYGRTVHLHLDALFVSGQIVTSSILSPGRVLTPFFVFSGSDLGSQSRLTSLGQSRGEISPIFGDIRHGSAGRHS